MPAEERREAGIARTPGLFDVDERLRRLSDIGDQLEAFAAVVNFEMFRGIPKAADL